MKTFRLFLTPVWCLFLSLLFHPLTAQDSGLLFHLSGDNGFTADYAAGNADPNYLRDVEIIGGGAAGNALHCKEGQLLSYWAPENIYARRGTLAFHWRAVTPFTETEFPIFRVGYADHSSWDMVFLRIDYNGHGFDAFVTDANLARVRTSVTVDPLPRSDEWTHFALAWDENEGIKFYLNGKLAGQRDTTVVLDAGLDQFGPHSRIISPYQVQSAYNFVRGGDIDEIRIYDQALTPAQITALAAGNVPTVASFRADLSQPAQTAEWNLRYGWNSLPPYLDSEETTVRKVQILETYDLKRWYWKSNDGIRETTWPGVYNRSHIIGRNDYFQLPDWDCYSTSGVQVRFDMPDEPWNHIEFSGGADGEIAVKYATDLDTVTYFTREPGQERTFHRMPNFIRGEELIFTNNVQETPIGEFDTYFVREGGAPQGIARLEYVFSAAGNANNPNVTGTLNYIRGRYPADERSVLIANPAGRSGSAESAEADAMPIAHLIIPSDFRSTGIATVSSDSRLPHYLSYTWHNLYGGLDGIRVTIPALDVEPLADGLFPLNIKVMDPIWPLRRMLDFSFSVKPGEPRVLWLDLRDRILPDDKPLYLMIAGASGFDASMLEGMRAELIFKPWDEAKEEHIADRFTQVRDNYAMIVEERPNNRRLNKYNQFEADMTDLLRIDPHHKEGREYWYIYNTEQPRPEVKMPEAKAGVPAWAHGQLEFLKKYRYWVEWIIDNRQIDNGEFGGGLSDDSDFGNWLPPLALMGVLPDKIENSVSAMMEAVYNNDMLDRGMSKIQSDGLHTFEEGTNVIGQINLLRVGDPKEVECLMEAAHSVYHHLIGVNHAGHTHFKSDYFSRTKLAESGVWAWSSTRQSLHLIPAIYLAEFYGNEIAKQLVIDMADGFLDHATVAPDGRVNIDSEIHFETDESRPSGIGNSVPLFWAAWRWTGDQKYLDVLTSRGAGGMSAVTSNIVDIAGLRPWVQEQLRGMTPASGNLFNRHLAWQTSGDKRFLETLYTDLYTIAEIREYTNTLGSVWTDRMVLDIEEIQRARLGGIAQTRNLFYPGHAVSWRFADERAAEQVAILFPYATPRELHIELFNTSDAPVEAAMTGWDVLNGEWEIEQNGAAHTATFGREETLVLTLPPMQSTVVRMKLKGAGTVITDRPDLAVGPEDVRREIDRVIVTVHNLGCVASVATEVALTLKGNVIQRATLPVIVSAADMQPKTAQVVLHIPMDINLNDLEIVIDPDEKNPEIRRTNNRIGIK